MNVSHVIVAMKPIEGNFVENALEFGVAGINVDGCRISTEGEDLGDPTRFDGADNHTRKEWHRPHMTDEIMTEKHRLSAIKISNIGRFPANILHDGSDEVKGKFPETGGERKPRVLRRLKETTGWSGGSQKTDNAGTTHCDSGSASRFFKELK